jgi:hypothetical protein
MFGLFFRICFFSNIFFDFFSIFFCENAIRESLLSKEVLKSNNLDNFEGIH